VRFVIDAQLPPALARFFVQRGHEASHVFDSGLLSASDRDIWEHAANLGAVLITKDEDFVTMRAFQTSGPPVVWVRLGNTTNRILLRYFDSMLPKIVAALERGETVVVLSEP
jgi:predicted nuclease of predicted toxin-antitoxin system